MLDKESRFNSLSLIADILVTENEAAVYIYYPPLPQAGYDTRSIFKGSTAGLNLEFFSP